MSGPCKEPQRALRFSVKLSWPVSSQDEMQQASIRFLRSLGVSHPQLIRELGLTVLTDRAVPAWEKNGLRIF
jgi:hypothetical protein